MDSLNRLHVGIARYQYLPKEDIPKKLSGFITERVGECVVGIISSDQGYGFFHYYRLNDPSKLLELIKSDFENSTSVKITLIGANPANRCLPWKEKNREISFNNDLIGRSALEALRKSKVEDYNYLLSSSFDTSGIYELKDIFEENKILLDNPPENLFKYDFSKINERIKAEKFEATSFHKSSSFKINGIKDFVNFQNLTFINNLSTSFDSDVQHYNCPNGYHVFADFNGNLGAIRSWPQQVVDKIEEFPNQLIENFHDVYIPKLIAKELRNH